MDLKQNLLALIVFALFLPITSQASLIFPVSGFEEHKECLIGLNKMSHRLNMVPGEFLGENGNDTVFLSLMNFEDLNKPNSKEFCLFNLGNIHCFDLTAQQINENDGRILRVDLLPLQLAVSFNIPATLNRKEQFIASRQVRAKSLLSWISDATPAFAGKNIFQSKQLDINDKIEIDGGFFALSNPSEYRKAFDKVLSRYADVTYSLKPDGNFLTGGKFTFSLKGPVSSIKSALFDLHEEVTKFEPSNASWLKEANRRIRLLESYKVVPREITLQEAMTKYESLIGRGLKNYVADISAKNVSTKDKDNLKACETLARKNPNIAESYCEIIGCNAKNLSVTEPSTGIKKQGNGNNSTQ